MDELERRIVNGLQGGFPLCPRPYAAAARALGLAEKELIERIGKLLSEGTLTRFGPMFDAERLGGAFTLCAMSVPQGEFERVARLVNAHPEVAHNYERAHRFNLWFVLAAAERTRLSKVIQAIEAETGYAVLDLPREREYFVELKLSA
ncbi:MAG: Lrp/AsnC family transcriptional regulator [Betaproteobacteria bacterium]|nr:MAG: Lrp/AsnC family transcriptional regulator [Betaproteobacteria bacterium]